MTDGGKFFIIYVFVMIVLGVILRITNILMLPWLWIFAPILVALFIVLIWIVIELLFWDHIKLG